jgi:hypothetical protein
VPPCIAWVFVEPASQDRKLVALKARAPIKISEENISRDRQACQSLVLSDIMCWSCLIRLEKAVNVREKPYPAGSWRATGNTALPLSWTTFNYLRQMPVIMRRSFSSDVRHTSGLRHKDLANHLR